MSSCAICLEPEMKSPAACVPCGHTFCHACILQWTRSLPRFGISLCPQCRSPVREVQKLFISDWPVGSGSSGVGMGVSQLSAWQQLWQLLTLLMHFLSIPVHCLTHYGPEVGRRVTVYLNRQRARLISLQTYIVRYAGVVVRDWCDLGLQAQCVVGAMVGLVLLLLVQDLQSKDGIHRGIVLPVLLLLLDMLQHAAFAVAFLLYRPLKCLAFCTGQVWQAALDVGGVVMWCGARVLWDAVCVPWLLLCVVGRVVGAALSLVAGVVRVVMFFGVLALSLGLPAFLASADHPGNQLPQLTQAFVDRVREAALRCSQLAVIRLQHFLDQYQHLFQHPQDIQQQQPDGDFDGGVGLDEEGVPDLHTLAQGLMEAVVQELHNLHREEGAAGGGGAVVGDGEGEGWDHEVDIPPLQVDSFHVR